MTPAIGTVGLALAPERAFLAALLLTANAQLAEIAVEESIRALDPVDLASEVLDVLAMGIAKQLQDESYEPQGNVPARLAQRLPLELQNVLRLPTKLRQCFVLRILHDLSVEFCTGLLGISALQLAICTREATVELAGMRPVAMAFELHACCAN